MDQNAPGNRKHHIPCPYIKNNCRDTSCDYTVGRAEPHKHCFTVPSGRDENRSKLCDKNLDQCHDKTASEIHD